VSIWRNVKTGAGLGFGGGFGFTLGQALARMLMRLTKLIVIALGVSGLGFCSVSELGKVPTTKPAGANHASQPKR